jgi:excisionase family DNA binding protein
VEPERKLFDIGGCAQHFRDLGAKGATPWFVRGLIARGELKYIRIGKKFYISERAIDAWLDRAERRG